MKKGFELNTFFNTYTVIQQIGQGGGGTVYKVKSSNAKEYALKVLRSESASKEKLKRFKNEMNFSIRADHPNILQVYDYGLSSDDHFFVMPLYNKSLRTYMKEDLQPSQIMKVINGVLHGLSFAHEKGVIHRDIKPENILINENGDAIISDFGIARFTDEFLLTEVETKVNSRMANFQYCAPEQRMKGGSICKATDLYAVGLIMNELFTGEIPIGIQFKRIVDVNQDFDYLDNVVEKLLNQSPSNRYLSAVDVINEISMLERIKKQKSKIKLLEETKYEHLSIEKNYEQAPEIVNVDWENGVLKIFLNMPVNSKWVYALNNMGNYSSIMGYGPEKFSIRGDEVTIKCESRLAQKLVDSFKQWLPTATHRYNDNLRLEKIEIERKEQARVSEKLRSEKERQQVLESIKF